MPDALSGSRASKASRTARVAADAPRPADLEFAIALAARAGEILMDRYERLERIQHKSARDVVTEADHLSEELIIESIRSYHPNFVCRW